MIEIDLSKEVAETNRKIEEYKNEHKKYLKQRKSVDRILSFLFICFSISLVLCIIEIVNIYTQ
ncbi:MAG: hypothetical protein MRY57_03985 [Candidatus Pacebacteria bacterium]|nr:hypothetical protein [Candidatus Paceibacterota bacterium]